MRRLALAMLVLVTIGCRATGTGSAVKESPEFGGGDNFIGCRPSAGECQNSCPTRNGNAVQDAQRCDPSSRDPLACYCGQPPGGGGGGSGGDGTYPSEATHMFVGCRPSMGECQNSCPTRQFVGIDDPNVCRPERPDGPIACFCAR